MVRWECLQWVGVKTFPSQLPSAAFCCLCANKIEAEKRVRVLQKQLQSNESQCKRQSSLSTFTEQTSIL